MCAVSVIDCVPFRVKKCFSHSSCNAWSYTSTPQCSFRKGQLIKPGYKFALLHFSLVDKTSFIMSNESFLFLPYSYFGPTNLSSSIRSRSWCVVFDSRLLVQYLLHITAVPFSNVCPQTDHPDGVFVVFPLCRQKPRQYLEACELYSVPHSFIFLTG